VSGAEAGWDLIRAAYMAVSRIAVVPLQDILALGSEARLNLPGRADGNWQWRLSDADLAFLRGGEPAAYLLGLAQLAGRAPQAGEQLVKAEGAR